VALVKCTTADLCLKSTRMKGVASTGSQDELQTRRALLVSDHDTLTRKIEKLLDAIEEGGSDVVARLAQRRAELQKTDGELGELDRMLAQQSLEIDDDALELIAERLSEKLRKKIDGAHQLVRAVVSSAEVFADRVVLRYSPAAVLDSANPVQGQCPHGNSNPGFGLERAAS
jgi:hypothetical protein